MRVEPATSHAKARLPLIAGALALTVAQGCSSVDYSGLESYYQRAPRTILIVPVRNHSTEAEAGRYFLATIFRPLVDRGYYVLPVEASGAVLEREGLWDEGLSWQVSPERYLQYFGADAILYITVEEWDTSYVVISSSVTVTLHYKLVSAKDGSVLWEKSTRQVQSSDSGSGFTSGGGIIGLGIGLGVMAVSAATTAAFTEYVALAAQANQEALSTLPIGAYHRDWPELEKKIADWRAAEDREKAGGG